MTTTTSDGGSGTGTGSGGAGSGPPIARLSAAIAYAISVALIEIARRWPRGRR